MNFRTIIEDILIINPKDKKTKDGSNFWKGSNRIPHIINYEENDNYFYYLEYLSYLLDESLGIPINKNKINHNEEQIKNIPNL